MKLDEWLRAHTFLDPLAQLLARVDGALAAIERPAAVAPRWQDYAADYRAGVPLLRSNDAELDLLHGGETARALIDALAAGEPRDEIAARARALAAELGGGSGSGSAAAQRVVDALLGDEGAPTTSPGLLRLLGWTAMRRWLQPVLVAFARWRDQDGWQRSHCPACGALPAMAQLVGVDPGRVRFLACGCCGSRWRYRRTACPFCENDTHRVEVLAVEGEAGLRVDHCETCRGYLKTYVGQGSEDVLLADWTSLHLDVLAQRRGLVRAAPSLFGLEPEAAG